MSFHQSSRASPDGFLLIELPNKSKSLKSAPPVCGSENTDQLCWQNEEKSGHCFLEAKDKADREDESQRIPDEHRSEQGLLLLEPDCSPLFDLTKRLLLILEQELALNGVFGRFSLDLSEGVDEVHS